MEILNFIRTVHYFKLPSSGEICILQTSKCIFNNYGAFKPPAACCNAAASTLYFFFPFIDFSSPRAIGPRGSSRQSLRFTPTWCSILTFSSVFSRCVCGLFLIPERRKGPNCYHDYHSHSQINCRYFNTLSNTGKDGAFTIKTRMILCKAW